MYSKTGNQYDSSIYIKNKKPKKIPSFFFIFYVSEQVAEISPLPSFQIKLILFFLYNNIASIPQQTIQTKTKPNYNVFYRTRHRFS